MVFLVAIASGIASLLSAPLAHNDGLEVMRRWKMNGGNMHLNDAYVRSVISLHRKDRRCYLLEHRSQVHVAVVDQRRQHVHVVEAFLWSPHSTDDERVSAISQFFNEYWKDRRRGLVPHLSKPDLQLWYRSMRNALF